MSVLERASEFLDSALLEWKNTTPLVLGISGPQGSGKSFLADNLLEYIKVHHPSLKAVGFLMDDFYLTHEDQLIVTKQAAEDRNVVLQGRGLPGTHDLKLLEEVFEKLAAKSPVRIPVYDKSAFNGEGDRAAELEWQAVTGKVDVVIFEGWFNGYRAMDPSVFRNAYLVSDPSGIVQRNKLYHLETVNAKLKEFDLVWARFDFFICLDTESVLNVYEWRAEQEKALIMERGKGMTEEQVHAFVDRYMPMYFLYYQWMCLRGCASENHNLQIKIDLGRRMVGCKRY